MNPSGHAELNPEGTRALPSNPSHIFIDVRTVQEFEGGHVEGAFNIPILLLGSHGLEVNPEFEATIERHFAKDAQLVFGCKAGIRSRRACEALGSRGYSMLTNMTGGMHDGMDAAGSRIEPGWVTLGYPTTTAAFPNRTWNDLEHPLA